ncbi:VCBS repeat-containing protein [Runella zeae]|uniref:VCBS repeat-containing protein n=1 Tax=Runella zeae TaxID=94255 RepID=UPI00040D7E0D|nr:VCBS repeat-containing protein [Runella zeae]
MKSIYLFLLFAVLVSCQKAEKAVPAFRLLEASQTGIAFSNDLKATNELNIFNYMYFYNGSGVGAGDFNNDGLIDVCFTGNLAQNRLYINRGKLKFEDVTPQTNINLAKGWANGVSVVDINQDGKLDLYINQVGGFQGFNGRNLLFICKEITKEGVPIYEEKAKEYGLDLVGFGTQAAFFDYDLDGDLDFFQLNHSVHQNGTFGFRSVFQGKMHPTAGDKFFRNDSQYSSEGQMVKPVFKEVTLEARIVSDVLGYGLGVGVGDVNFDGYPDMYIGNDFHENDYLYINQQNGQFKEDLENQIMHTSQFSMGIDIGDINNDILPEIISLDMLPYDKEILKRSEGEDSYNIFKYKIRQGYNHQFARNNLQLNLGPLSAQKNPQGAFSEIGMYTGVYATDWSWAPLFMDFDNDGRKDLFISNGIPKRMNDIDYIQFVSNESIQAKMNKGEFTEDDPSVVEILPEIKLPNKFYLNTPTLQFQDWQNRIMNDKPSFSNGAVYADLDNDGDLEVITNNINDKAFIYENLANEYAPTHQSLTLHLKGSSHNRNAIGAKCLIFKGKEVLSYEKFPVRGFQASMEVPLTIGLGNKAEVDSMYVIWPDKRFQKIDPKNLPSSITITYQATLPVFDYAAFVAKMIRSVAVEDVTEASGLDFVHQENNFNEFDREALIPHLASSEGPALALGDINRDGLEDVFLGNARDGVSKVYLQNAKGKFVYLKQPEIAKDSAYEDVDAVFADVNADSHLDLIVASGGNEFFGNSEYLQPRVYLNDGKGNFARKKDAFTDLFVTASTVRAFDFTGDGKMDLFIGGRSIPKAYGDNPRSYLLQNDGTGKFVDITEKIAPDLKNIGMVKNVELVDIEGDKDTDLVLSIEWQGVCIMENNKGTFTKKMLTEAKGWWNFTLTSDFDADGDLDILVGNLGLNSRLKATPEQPVKLYVGDIDKNDRVDQILTYFLNGQETLFANKMETDKQFPFIKKQYIHAKDFAQASVEALFGRDKLEKMKILTATEFANCILLNDGKGNFTLKPLPIKAQWTTFRAGQIIDVNGDKLPDVLIAGNFYDNNIQMGRYDADYGTVLLNQGKGEFEVRALSTLVKGQVRHIATLRQPSGQPQLILAKNNDKAQVIALKK